MIPLLGPVPVIVRTGAALELLTATPPAVNCHFNVTLLPRLNVLFAGGGRFCTFTKPYTSGTLIVTVAVFESGLIGTLVPPHVPLFARYVKLSAP